MFVVKCVFKQENWAKIFKYGLKRFSMLNGFQIYWRETSGRVARCTLRRGLKRLIFLQQGRKYKIQLVQERNRATGRRFRTLVVPVTD